MMPDPDQEAFEETHPLGPALEAIEETYGVFCCALIGEEDLAWGLAGCAKLARRLEASGAMVEATEKRGWPADRRAAVHAALAAVGGPCTLVACTAQGYVVANVDPGAGQRFGISE